MSWQRIIQEIIWVLPKPLIFPALEVGFRPRQAQAAELPKGSPQAANVRQVSYRVRGQVRREKPLQPLHVGRRHRPLPPLPPGGGLDHGGRSLHLRLTPSRIISCIGFLFFAKKFPVPLPSRTNSS